MTENPFEPPLEQTAATANQPNGNRLTIPAGFLLGLSAVWSPLVLLASANAAIEGPANGETAAFHYCSVIAVSSLTVFQLMGQVSLLRRSNLRLAWVGAVISALPGCSPCILLGIPFAFWSMYLLTQEDVVAQFRQGQSNG